MLFSRVFTSSLLGARTPPFLHNRCARPLSTSRTKPTFEERRTVRTTVTTVNASGTGDSVPAEDPPAFLKITSVLLNLFPLWVGLGCVSGLFFPSLYIWFVPYVVPALAFTMLLMGTTMELKDFAGVLKQPALVGLGAALQYTIMPSLGYIASRSFGLEPGLAAGVILMSACPGGTASNIVTFIAGADVALSVLMTTASTFLSVFTTPFLTQLLVGTLVPVDAGGMFLSTVQVVLLPVALGIIINACFPKQVKKAAAVSPLAAAVTVALICASVVAKNAPTVLASGPSLLGALFFVHTGGFLSGYFISRALGLSEKIARTNSIEVGMQNSTLGAALSGYISPIAGAPCAISACMHSILGSAFAAFWSWKDRQAEAQRRGAAA